MSDIRQLKLITGEEIICQILDWADDQEVDIVVRNVYQVSAIDDDTKGIRYYSLKPWMTMQEGDDKYITVNTMHIVSQAKPHGRVQEQFENAVEHSNLDQEEIKEKVKDYIEKMQLTDEDDFENVINFPNLDKDKLH